MHYHPHIPLTKSISDLRLMVCSQKKFRRVLADFSTSGASYLSLLLIILLIDTVYGLLYLAKHKIAVAIVGLDVSISCEIHTGMRCDLHAACP